METGTWSEFPDRGKVIVNQTLASDDRSKPKRAGLRASQSGIQVGKLTVWVGSFQIEKF